MGVHIESGSTLRRDLSAVANEFAAEEARRWGYIADRVAPVFPVAEADATYPVWCRENMLKRSATRRNEDGTYNRVDGTFGTQSYSCEEFGLETLLDDRRRRRFSSFLDFERAMTRMLLHQILLDREIRLAAIVMNATTYSATAASASWGTVGTDILGDVNSACVRLSGNTGIPRDMFSLIVSAATFWDLNRNTAILAQFSATYSPNLGIRPGMLTAAQIAQVLNIGEIVVAGGSYDTKGEGVTESISTIWSDAYVQLCVLAPPGSVMESPGAWRTLLWTPDSPTLPVVERYRSDERRGEVLRDRYDADEVATAEADLMNDLITMT